MLVASLWIRQLVICIVDCWVWLFHGFVGHLDYRSIGELDWWACFGSVCFVGGLGGSLGHTVGASVGVLVDKLNGRSVSWLAGQWIGRKVI